MHPFEATRKSYDPNLSSYKGASGKTATREGLSTSYLVTPGLSPIKESSKYMSTIQEDSELDYLQQRVSELEGKLKTVNGSPPTQQPMMSQSQLTSSTSVGQLGGIGRLGLDSTMNNFAVGDLGLHMLRPRLNDSIRTRYEEGYDPLRVNSNSPEQRGKGSPMDYLYASSDNLMPSNRSNLLGPPTSHHPGHSRLGRHHGHGIGDQNSKVEDGDISRNFDTLDTFMRTQAYINQKDPFITLETKRGINDPDAERYNHNTELNRMFHYRNGLGDDYQNILAKQSYAAMAAGNPGPLQPQAPGSLFGGMLGTPSPASYFMNNGTMTEQMLAQQRMQNDMVMERERKRQLEEIRLETEKLQLERAKLELAKQQLATGDHSHYSLQNNSSVVPKLQIPHNSRAEASVNTGRRIDMRYVNFDIHSLEDNKVQMKKFFGAELDRIRQELKTDTNDLSKELNVIKKETINANINKNETLKEMERLRSALYTQNLMDEFRQRQLFLALSRNEADVIRPLAGPNWKKSMIPPRDDEERESRYRPYQHMYILGKDAQQTEFEVAPLEGGMLEFNDFVPVRKNLTDHLTGKGSNIFATGQNLNVDFGGPTGSNLGIKIGGGTDLFELPDDWRNAQNLKVPEKNYDVAVVEYMDNDDKLAKLAEIDQDATMNKFQRLDKMLKKLEREDKPSIEKTLYYGNSGTYLDS